MLGARDAYLHLGSSYSQPQFFSPKMWGCLSWSDNLPFDLEHLWEWRRTFKNIDSHIVDVVQLLRRVRLFATPWTAACQASLYFTISRSLLKLMSVESVMPSDHLILFHPLLLLPSIFPSIRVISDVGSLYQVAKGLELQLQHQSFQWISRT